MSTPKDGSVSTRRERAAALQASRARAEKRRRRTIVAVVVIVILVAAGVIAAVVASSSGGKKPAAAVETGPMGPEGIVLEQGTALAPLSTAAQGKTVDGVECNSSEQPAYHIHTHVAVYVNGALRPIPAGVGVVQPVAQQTASGPFDQASSCYYWLHVHAQDGIIHVEAPTNRAYTLGQFFAIWGQPLTTTRVGTASGNVTVFVDGKKFTGDPASITLGSRKDIQIDVGTVVPFKTIDWSHAQL